MWIFLAACPSVSRSCSLLCAQEREKQSAQRRKMKWLTHLQLLREFKNLNCANVLIWKANTLAMRASCLLQLSKLQWDTRVWMSLKPPFYQENITCEIFLSLVLRTWYDLRRDGSQLACILGKYLLLKYIQSITGCHWSGSVLVLCQFIFTYEQMGLMS